MDRHATPGARAARPIALLVALLAGTTVAAGDVRIEQVVFQLAASGAWRVDTTLRHADTGWEHYADAWRVVDADGKVLGERVLHHPHVNEQPFTRSLSGVRIAPVVRTVFVEARDSQHGWSPDRVRVDLQRPSGERFTVRR